MAAHPADSRTEEYSHQLAKVTLYEGRNRQVRRMTAHVGHPTLRLIRYSMGDYTLNGLDNGQWREIAQEKDR